MLEMFRDEIPDFETLAGLIGQMIGDPKYDLEDIREAIRDHIVECRAIPDDDDEKHGEADSLAYNIRE